MYRDRPHDGGGLVQRQVLSYSFKLFSSKLTTSLSSMNSMEKEENEEEEKEKKTSKTRTQKEEVFFSSSTYNNFSWYNEKSFHLM